MSWFGRLQTQRFLHRSSKAGVSNDNESCLQIRVVPHMQSCVLTIWIWGCSTSEINLYPVSFGQEWEKLILMTHTTGSPAINQIFEWRLILKSQTIGNLFHEVHGLLPIFVISLNFLNDSRKLQLSSRKAMFF
jgi:hypothetical protein